MRGEACLGKGQNLIHLKESGFNVPPFFIIDNQFFKKKIDCFQDDIDKLLDKNENEEITSLKIAELFLKKFKFTQEDIEEINKKIETIFVKNEKLAIRSSINDEDSEEFSFAGQMDSFLNVDRQDVLENIKKCIMSAYSKRAIFYRRKNKISLKGIGGSVIVQKMINADFSGVIFTTNPLTNNPNELLINVTKGTGEKLVNGEIDSDIWIFSKEGDLLYKKDTTGADKNILNNLRSISVRIEESYEKRLAKDIEFCIKNNEIYILQSRPITKYLNADKKEEAIVLDNSNIGESYPSVTTELSFCFAKFLYKNVYKNVCENVNKNADVIKSFEGTFSEMVYFHENKVYYNMNNWYKCLSLVPGYNLNKRFMENMMGVKSKMEVEIPKNNTGKFKEIYYLFRALQKMTVYLVKMEKKSEKFHNDFDKNIGKYKDMDFSTLSEEEVYKIYDILCEKVLGNWFTPIANDMCTMLFYGLFTNKIKEYYKNDYENIINELLSIDSEVYSVKPVEELLKIVKYIKSDEKLSKDFKRKDIETLKKEYRANKELAKIIDSYVSKYGARTLNEQKLECLTMKQDIGILFSYLKGYLNIEDKEVNRQENKKDNYLEILSRKDKKIVKYLIKKNKFFIKNREHLRFRRTEAFGVAKEVFKRLGGIYVENGIIEKYEDIYHLKLDEIMGDIRYKKADITTLKKKINERKIEFLKSQNRKDSVDCERIYIYKESGASFKIKSIDDIFTKDKGIPCVEGIVEGKVQILDGNEEFKVCGDILVAERIDPGYVPLFSMFKGIIVERGSVLSHAAIVARELNIPTIVSYKGITTNLKTGQNIRLNGGTGEVEILK